jgi:hypothetical protein
MPQAHSGFWVGKQSFSQLGIRLLARLAYAERALVSRAGIKAELLVVFPEDRVSTHALEMLHEANIFNVRVVSYCV